MFVHQKVIRAQRKCILSLWGLYDQIHFLCCSNPVYVMTDVIQSSTKAHLPYLVLHTSPAMSILTSRLFLTGLKSCACNMFTYIETPPDFRVYLYVQSSKYDGRPLSRSYFCHFMWKIAKSAIHHILMIYDRDARMRFRRLICIQIISLLWTKCLDMVT